MSDLLIQTLLAFVLTWYPGDFDTTVALPKIAIVTRYDLGMRMCGCDCGVGGAYVRQYKMPGYEGPIILIVGSKELIEEPTPGFKSLFIHEITHHVQHVVGDDRAMLAAYRRQDMKRITILRRTHERAAYRIQYRFLGKKLKEESDKGFQFSNQVMGSGSVCTDPFVEQLLKRERPSYNSIPVIRYFHQ